MCFYFLWDFQNGFVTYPASSQGEREGKAHLQAHSLETSEAVPFMPPMFLNGADKDNLIFFGWVECNFDLTCYIWLHICAL